MAKTALGCHKQSKKLEVLKIRILEYQKEQTTAKFEEILLLTDNLVLYFVHKYRRWYSHLRIVPIEDLYQTAIIGLYYAITTSPSTEHPDRLPARIGSYIISKLNQMYRNSEKEIPCDMPVDYENMSTAEKHVGSRMTDFITDYTYLVDKKLITKEEDKSFRDMFLYGKSVKNLYMKHNIKARWKFYKFKMTMEKIKSLLEMWRPSNGF